MAHGNAAAGRTGAAKAVPVGMWRDYAPGGQRTEPAIASESGHYAHEFLPGEILSECMLVGISVTAKAPAILPACPLCQSMARDRAAEIRRKERASAAIRARLMLDRNTSGGTKNRSRFLPSTPLSRGRP